MSELRRRLVEQYAVHYARLNVTVDASAMSADALRAMNLTYGALLDGVPPGGQVLDVGCGAGLLLHWLSARPGIVATGVDASAGQVALARRNAPRATVLHTDAVSYLHGHRAAFSGIFCLDLLEHVPQPELMSVVEGLRDALLPGGFVVCKGPNAANLTAAQLRYVDLTHERAFTKRSLVQLLEAADLGDCRVVPVRSAHLSGRVRLVLERVLHRLVYWICGDTDEDVFTRTIAVAAYRK